MSAARRDSQRRSAIRKRNRLRGLRLLDRGRRSARSRVCALSRRDRTARDKVDESAKAASNQTKRFPFNPVRPRGSRDAIRGNRTSCPSFRFVPSSLRSFDDGANAAFSCFMRKSTIPRCVFNLAAESSEISRDTICGYTAACRDILTDNL